MNSIEIVSIGKAIPDTVITNDRFMELAGVDDEWIIEHCGIKERRVLTEGNTSDLATTAAMDALNKAKVDPMDIDLIIVSTCTPDSDTPSTACLVQKKIGADNAVCFDIKAACSGFIYALSAADKFLRAGSYKNALVIGAEMLSKATDWHEKKSGILFGDGAGAAFVVPCEKGGILAEELGSIGKKSDVLVTGVMPGANAFNDVEPVKQEDMYIRMDGLAVFGFATKKLRSSIENVLNETNLTLDDIKYIVPHQANMRIIESVAKRLKTTMDKFYINIERFGNTSSASIGIALTELEEQGLLQKGDKIIISGFGGGLTWGTMLIEW
ncbi:MAG: ketoacyl-ACP synthase III [Lachnospiraceae bacterium]|nr:ketoacyl-ACP synthase III [Lachnospiraceae bacterium]